jgi:hypothetical protein
MERTMKVQEVILRALAKKITWWQAAEIIGISDRQMRRWPERYEEFGFRGLFDRRRGKPSPKKVPLAVVEKVLELYREKYFDLNVRHFTINMRVLELGWQGAEAPERRLTRRISSPSCSSRVEEKTHVVVPIGSRRVARTRPCVNQPHT